MPNPSAFSGARAPPLQTVRGAPSWRLANDAVEAFITQRGGHLAPVTFLTAAGPVQPFAVAPWASEPLASDTPDLLKTLRGDFFCAPFGGNAARWRGEQHPPHGETASSEWQGATVSTNSSGCQRLEAAMELTVRPGRATKLIEVRGGQTNVYCRHVLHEMTGPMSLGHHAMLQCPEAAGGARIALSPYRGGQVCPEPFENPAQGGYAALKTGATFHDLHQVPLAPGGVTDLTCYPAREGFDDLVMVSARPRKTPAWSTVTFPARGYVWFSLRDAAVLASTVLWFSNGGRHYAPWNGRHRGVLGVEDVTSYFHFGLAESARENSRSRRGIPTHVRLARRRPITINYLMGVVPIPAGFDRVRTIRFVRDGIVVASCSGMAVEHRVDIDFINPKTRAA